MIVQCDLMQVQVISTVRIAVVGKPVHPLPNRMIISLLKVRWKKRVSHTCGKILCHSYFPKEDKLHFNQ